MAKSTASSTSIKEDDTPKTPAKRKPNNDGSSNKPTNVPNGALAAAIMRKASSPQVASPRTPLRKHSTQPNLKTPNSAPARARKAPEPTLLGDFLLGRPSPARQRNNGIGAKRRQSLDAVKREMRAEVVAQVRAPGKVNDRVKEWQKQSRGAGKGEQPEEIVVEYETDSEVGGVPVQEKIAAPKQRLKRKSRTKPPDHGDDDERGRGATPDDGEDRRRERSKSVAPKKRVISDDHWMMKKKKSPKGKGASIPKNFLKVTAINPPFEKKIEDWVKRMEDEPAPVLEKPRSRSRKVLERDVADGARKAEEPRAWRVENLMPGDDGIRVKPMKVRPDRQRASSTPRVKAAALQDDGIRIKPMKERPDRERAFSTSRVKAVALQDDGIRVFAPKTFPNDDDGIKDKLAKGRPSKERMAPVSKGKVAPQDDGIRVTASNTSFNDDGIRIRPSRESSPQSDLRIKPVRKDGSKRRPKEEGESPTPTPRKKSKQHVKPSSETETGARVTSHGTASYRDEDIVSHVTPAPRPRSSRRSQKSETPTETLDEIPFGNSAFSVLDLPLGAEANTMRRSESKRTPSFSAVVPKVLKRVYTEGKKMMQDTAEPPRGGINQPPSIDSWLNGTVDPLAEEPVAQPDTLKVPTAPVSRLPSKKEGDRAEKHIEPGPERSEQKHQSNKRKSWEKEESPRVKSPGEARDRNTLPSMENSPPASSSGLRRSPATRNMSSPKSPRKLTLKEAVLDAFKGESSVAKKDSPSPFDFIGMRDRDVNRLESVAENPPPKRTPRVDEDPTSQQPNLERALPSFPRRLAPTTGNHRLSTIASVETFRTGTESSLTETSAPSELTQTTLTQSSVLTGTTASTLSQTTASSSSLSRTTGTSLSRHSKVSTSNRSNKSNSGGLKRRLTKHSDLVSMLSLPDSEVPGRGHSIKSARSIRTTKANLETATVQDIFRELADDEAKYMRELNTLVDGVIPVLLTCVLSKSELAIATGLFDPLASSTDNLQTKPIVDMGVALERLKSLHKRIPLTDPLDFIRWAESAVKTYEDFIHAWRSGFEDVVVNLAPASRTDSMAVESDRDKMKIDKHGDVLRDTGERADVGYMLKRPLVRTKGLAKATKGFAMILGTEKAEATRDKYEELQALRRRRVEEESARKEDLRAINTDTSRVHDLRTMSHVKGVTISRHRNVMMKDVFDLEIFHSSGEQYVCETEITFRSGSSKMENDGDILICQTDENENFLLFPPISMKNISARQGDRDTELVVMVRGQAIGINGREEWSECLVLDADDAQIAGEWLLIFGLYPIPPSIKQYTPMLDPELETVLSQAGDDTKSIVGALKSKSSDEIPFGERPRREAEEEIRGGQPGLMHAAYSLLSKDAISKLSDDCVLDIEDLNDAMMKADRKSFLRLPKYGWATTLNCVMSGGLDPYAVNDEDSRPRSRDDQDDNAKKPSKYDNIFLSKRRSPSPQAQTNTPLKEAMRPELTYTDRYHEKIPSQHEDTPPPPPAHKTPPRPALKLTPVLDSPTPRARNRRTSSPLKHEYQPSEDASGTSSAAEATESESGSEEYTTSEDDSDDLEEEETRPTTATTIPVINVTEKAASRPASIYNHPNASLAPSMSASQAPLKPVIRPAAPRPETATTKITAMISHWSDSEGRWIDVCDGLCSVVVGPGRVEGFDIGFANSISPGEESYIDRKPTTDSDPLVGQDITPHVSLRRSTKIDIEIKAPPSPSSRMKGTRLTLRYRSINAHDSVELYKALHSARMENLKFKILEEERLLSSYGHNSRYRTILRNKSFRRSEASVAALSTAGSEKSSLGSALSAVKRFGIGGMFNIGKSSLQAGEGNGGISTSSSDYSNITPHTNDPSLAANSQSGGSLWSNGVTVHDLGWQDISIRLYIATRGGKWDDLGPAHLTVQAPPPGMRQASSLNHGPQKRITVTQRFGNGEEDVNLILDCALGADCFSKMGHRGVIANVWEDIRGDNGVVGFASSRGGVAGRVRKWCFQTARSGDCQWIYMLCRSGLA
ncbi:hypothetical protein MBM_00982 [Drepanopeziza brunnea f. sp. 'multigermtubi' MB_m1]|uniref:DH domain-containing protein n=1 Tax=Marssonina brunnea f. sp. multigermtubi (strain MB_m1) TaxID=1072389 RepID=K1WRK4_MARBU|nr:uncharacterized protein MBM_00982 [Drepanopeziza brunnea f. sp. 'multigermtubi' MB_m1]EKD20300.1 hypothetical protein MBM_00982 [Drepanopeziza brunnea f. sp. 'multigermtubi' MB_m1]